MSRLLNVDNLETKFRTADGHLPAVRKISFSVDKEETLCIVGESGCGKSITSLSIMGLLPSNGEITGGSIRLDDENLIGKSEEEMEQLRGNALSMIFQEPMTALNPVLTIGYQLREPLTIHKNMSKKEATKASIELLDKVGIPDSKEKLDQYPHELSGGMRQRVMIAMALACEPSLLVADEPTTALDVTIQAQILDLIHELQSDIGMGVIFVTHDMGVVADIADRVMVMYAGEVVEVADVESIFENPQHPYTKGLLESVPDVDDVSQELQVIKGSMPGLNDEISGCRFHLRCPFATEVCKHKEPPSFEVTPTHYSKCWLQEVNQSGQPDTIT
ncbi:oligopeptide transport system ATP-binding protein [Lentibacillus halodurans]|uniref:Oligopeptide transport system ATP-binding protein n=1 Tax=Lentibacillus halodurans TaxID=237679 RepID=A0A1I0W919_9BACI|nr:ABC transporter ATP-binding protein [Lentibacillus halodurans]SFA84750.1 oligopeptide transport system ATP-binding protein [Lentibacillus halodurans]